MARPPPTECEACFGCGHLCTRCEYPVNACLCEYRFGLDTEEMEQCKACGGTGDAAQAPTEYLH
jgi:hypothetical protein